MTNPPASVESGHIVLEREIKLTATPSFRLPALGDLVEGMEAVPVPPQRLTATYFDTDDLRLARWGASLVAERWLRVWVQRSRSAPAAFAARARWPEAWQALLTRLGGWS